MSKVDLPGYGTETSPDDDYEWCSCSKVRRRVGSTKLCPWCECDGDRLYDEMRDRELGL